MLSWHVSIVSPGSSGQAAAMPPFVSSGVLRMLFIISQAIIPTAELTPRLICLLLWRFLNREGCANDTVHYLPVTVWQAVWKRDFFKEELISIKAVPVALS